MGGTRSRPLATPRGAPPVDPRPAEEQWFTQSAERSTGATVRWPAACYCSKRAAGWAHERQAVRTQPGSQVTPSLVRRAAVHRVGTVRDGQRGPRVRCATSGGPRAATCQASATKSCSGRFATFWSATPQRQPSACGTSSNRGQQRLRLLGRRQAHSAAKREAKGASYRRVGAVGRRGRSSRPAWVSSVSLRARSVGQPFRQKTEGYPGSGDVRRRQCAERLVVVMRVVEMMDVACPDSGPSFLMITVQPR